MLRPHTDPMLLIMGSVQDKCTFWETAGVLECWQFLRTSTFWDPMFLWLAARIYFEKLLQQKHGLWQFDFLDFQASSRSFWLVRLGMDWDQKFFFFHWGPRYYPNNDHFVQKQQFKTGRLVLRWTIPSGVCHNCPMASLSLMKLRSMVLVM